MREIRGAKDIAGDLFRDADFKGLISQKAVWGPTRGTGQHWGPVVRAPLVADGDRNSNTRPKLRGLHLNQC